MFTICGKGRHIRYHGGKNSRIEFLPMRTGSKIGEKFLMVKISGCTVTTVFNTFNY